MFGEGVDLFGNSKVPGSDPVGLEERDLLVVGAARDFSGDQLVKFVDGVPFLRLLLERNDQVAGFLPGLLDGIHEDDGGAGDGSVVEFALVGVVCADGVDMGTFGDVVSVEDWLGGSGGRVDNICASDGFGGGRGSLDRDAETGGHFGAEVSAAFGIAAEDADGIQLAGRGDGFQLSLCLATGAEDGGGVRMLARKIFGGDAGSGAGALLAHEVGFDQGEKSAGGNFVKRDEEAKDSFYIGVLLHGDEAGFRVHGGHVVEEATTGGEFEAAARMENYAAVGLLAGDFLDRVHRHGHGEKLADLGFVDVEGHGLAPDVVGGA